MVKKTLIIVAVIFTNHMFSQATANRFFEYAESADTNLAIINVKAPLSIEKTDTTDVEIKVKGEGFVMIKYLKRESRTRDTCYIATYIDSYWAGLDPTNAESDCEIDKNNCDMLIVEEKSHMIRFRIGRKTKSYRLILKK